MTQIATVEQLLPGDYAVISVPRKSACGHDCEECAGCGVTGAAVQARAANPIGAKPGQKVVVQSDTQKMLGIVALVYLTPVVLFLLGVHKLSVPHKIRLKQLFPGAFLSGVAWFIYSIAFSYYVDHIANYSLIYGSFATVVVALIWLNISLMTLLIGAEYNRVLMEEKGETLI